MKLALIESKWKIGLSRDPQQETWFEANGLKNEIDVFESV